MSEFDSNAVEKVHPASREVLPDDPLSLHGVEVPGDADLMMRCEFILMMAKFWNLA